MMFRNFISDKVYVLALNLCCGMLLILFLYFTGTGYVELVLILICWGIILSFWLIVAYVKSKKKFTEMHSIMEFLDKKYLFSEMMEKPSSAVEREYFDIMRHAMKSMTEHVSESERKRNEYQQFIEQWIHEIKRPITASKLICENNKNEYTRKLNSQIEEIERHVERVLYYARLGYVERDYLIRKTPLNDIVEVVLTKNKQMLIQNSVRIKMGNLQHIVYCDEKWIVFVLNQIITNCVQYRKDSALISITAAENENDIELDVKDNGIGVKESEIGRIFQHGFTGSNGRNGNNSTGIGLYLCKELCQKLDIEIHAQSVLGQFTEVILSFPKVKQT